MAGSILISNMLPDEARALIPTSLTVDYHPSELPLPKDELVARLQGKDALICHIISRIDDDLLTRARGLRIVANVAVGYDNIDVAAARRHGVIVTNTPDVLTET